MQINIIKELNNRSHLKAIEFIDISDAYNIIKDSIFHIQIDTDGENIFYDAIPENLYFKSLGNFIAFTNFPGAECKKATFTFHIVPIKDFFEDPIDKTIEMFCVLYLFGKNNNLASLQSKFASDTSILGVIDNTYRICCEAGCLKDVKKPDMDELKNKIGGYES